MKHYNNVVANVYVKEVVPYDKDIVHYGKSNYA